jgi:hypothetical protein
LLRRCEQPRNERHHCPFQLPDKAIGQGEVIELPEEEYEEDCMNLVTHNLHFLQ